MRTVGNILWFIFGGALMGVGWYIAGTLAFISIIGIPWGRACFVIGTFTFAPFGKEVAYRDDVSGKKISAREYSEQLETSSGRYSSVFGLR